MRRILKEKLFRVLLWGEEESASQPVSRAKEMAAVFLSPPAISNMPDETINKMYQKLGGVLIDKGILFSRTAYKLNPKVFTRVEILSFLQDQTGIPLSSLSVADEKIYAESWEKWGNIIDYDLLNQQQYLEDKKDCDNFALLFSARSSLIYGLNSCGTAFGSIHDPVTKQLIGYHAFNLIITQQDGELKLRLYEPMADTSALWVKGQDNSLQYPGWLYRPQWILLF